ncbi:MAG: hypothetical protein FWG51_00730 [Firmicutes bacterium]|nr:hypothetical protein [Bacillota bacterium]
MIKLRDNKKLIGVVILCFAAVFICAMFMNYGLDLNALNNAMLDEAAQSLFEAQKSMSSITVTAAGGVMGAITLIVLLFIVNRFIYENQSNMGVLKAMGYPAFKIAVSFLKFGLVVLFGCLIGYAAGMAFSPVVYGVFNDGALPDVIFTFHFEVLIYLIIAPFIVFSALSYLYAVLKLKRPPLDMIHQSQKSKTNKLSLKLQNRDIKKPFLRNLKTTMLFNSLALIFFVFIAGFGFAGQIQIAILMIDIEMDFTFAALNLTMGFILGLVALILALSYVVNSNSKYLSLLKAYGYTDSECNRALLGGYRIIAYIGFAIGSVYQLFFMKFMVSLYADTFDVAVNFNIPGFFITLGAFVAFYELAMLYFKRNINKIPLKEIMQV